MKAAEEALVAWVIQNPRSLTGTYYKWLPKESRSGIDELDTRPDATYTQPETEKSLRKSA